MIDDTKQPVPLVLDRCPMNRLYRQSEKRVIDAMDPRSPDAAARA